MNDDEDFGSEEPKAAFMGSSSSAKTMADGSLRITVDLSPGDAIGAFTAFGAPGSPVALARIRNAAALTEMRDTIPPVKEYGQESKALFQSSFFRNPDVWRAIGTDAQYLEWVKHQPSAHSGEFSEYHDDGESYCVPAHVRRVEHGSGTGTKPPYAAIPLTNDEHQLTHQHGDSVIDTEEWWDKQRIKYLHAWCWETAKIQILLENPGLECTSFGCISPKLVEGWAYRRGIQRFLPGVYKGHVNGEAEVHQETDIG